MKNDYVKLFGLGNSRYAVINNPVNLKEVDKLKILKLNTKFEINNSKRYIISIGRFHKHKRQKDLIDAFKFINEKYEDLEVVLLGEGNRKDELKNYVLHLGLEEKIHFLGNVKNPYYYLYNSWCYVSTSSSEGFPNALLEAMSCGIPVISSDCLSGPREILAPRTDENVLLKNGIEMADYGILYPVGNVMSLVNALEILLKNRTIYNVYAKKSLERVKNFDLENIVEIYKEVLFSEDIH